MAFCLIPAFLLLFLIRQPPLFVVRTRAARASRLTSIHEASEANVSDLVDGLPADGHTHTFLSEFSEFRHTYDLLPLDLPLDFDGPLDAFLSDIETGSIRPIRDDLDDEE